MCEPTERMPVPARLGTACDAVASYFLNSRQDAIGKLFATQPDVDFFLARQRLIEHVQEQGLRVLGGTTSKFDELQRAHDVLLWYKCSARKIMEGTVGTLEHELGSVLNNAEATGKRWSLQVLGATPTQPGHHLALGLDLPNPWLLDPASSLMFFKSKADLAKYAQNLLTSSNIGPQNRTVLLEIVDPPPIG